MVIEDHPGLALRTVERAALENLLPVRPSLWSRNERRYLKSVLRSLRRAVSEGLGYGETPHTHEDGEFPMIIDCGPVEIVDESDVEEDAAMDESD